MRRSSPLSSSLLVLLVLAVLLPPEPASAAPRRRAKTTKSAPKTPAAKPAPSEPEPAAPAKEAAPEPAAAAPASASERAPEPGEPPPPPAVAKAAAPKPAKASRPSEPSPKASSSDSPTAVLDRIGVGVDGFLGGGGVKGEQWINATRLDESFTYAHPGLSGTAWLLLRHGSVERLRYGPALRVYGNYAAMEGQNFTFGPLFEGLITGEYSLPAIEKFDGILGARAGLAVLIPGGDFEAEIARLRREGVDVWGVPRAGFAAGLNVGTRRRMGEHLWLRADILWQYRQLFLFATDQNISGLRFRKSWSADGMTLGLNLGVELAL
jgi:hypothetical protein